jgi:hypothetical protein
MSIGFSNGYGKLTAIFCRSPHIAGLAALELPHMVSKKPADIYKAIIKRATTHKIKKLASHTVNGIAYSKF